MARQMPKRGYYVFESADYPEIIAVTGTTKGNKYMRPEFKEDGWADLLWTCVPAQKELDKNYKFSETLPVGWWGGNELDLFVAEVMNDGITGIRPEVPPPNPPKKRTASDDIKDQLAQKTGIAKSRWSRWPKVKVGSPADVAANNLAAQFPQHKGKICRILGGSNGVKTLYYAVFEETDGSSTFEDITGTHPHLV